MPLTFAYIMSRFPKISETFILYEILEMERLGTRVEVYPLVRERDAIRHPEAEAIVARAHYPRLLSAGAVADQLHWLRRRPLRYLSTWAGAIAGNLGSPRFLARALVVVPEAASFARSMQRLGVDHIHAHYATHPALGAWVASRLLDLPYSFTVHAHDLYVDRSMLRHKLRAAARVVTISEYNRDLIGRLYGPAARRKTAVVRLGVDLELFRGRVARPKEAGPPVVLCVASLQDYKGHPVLLDALAILLERGVDFRCRLVGEGEDRPAIAAQIERLGLGGHVELLGAQPRARVLEILGEAAVFALPSVVTPSGKREGIPVALMEALAMELPVVATDISGVGELVRDGETGLLVPEREAGAFAAALERVLLDEELARRLAAAGRATVAREYDLRANAAALHRVLAGASSRR